MYFITAPGGKPASESTVAVSNRAVLIVSRIYTIKCQVKNICVCSKNKNYCHI